MAKKQKSFLLTEGGNAYQMVKVIAVDKIADEYPVAQCDAASADAVRDQCTALGAALWFALAETKRQELINLHGHDVAEKQEDDTYMVNIDLLKKLVWHSLLQSDRMHELVDQFIDIESLELQAYEEAAKKQPAPTVRRRPKPNLEVTRWGGGL